MSPALAGTVCGSEVKGSTTVPGRGEADMPA